MSVRTGEWTSEKANYCFEHSLGNEFFRRWALTKEEKEKIEEEHKREEERKRKEDDEFWYGW